MIFFWILGGLFLFAILLWGFDHVSESMRTNEEELKRIEKLRRFEVEDENQWT